MKEGEVPIKRVRKLIKKKKRINDEADAMEDQASQSFFSDEREESPSEERKKVVSWMHNVTIHQP